MVAKIDVISEASHKHVGEVTALCFDGENLYSGSTDGVINVRKLMSFPSDFFFDLDIFSLVPLNTTKKYSILNLIIELIPKHFFLSPIFTSYGVKI